MSSHHCVFAESRYIIITKKEKAIEKYVKKLFISEHSITLGLPFLLLHHVNLVIFLQQNNDLEKIVFFAPFMASIKCFGVYMVIIEYC